jgi:hypothetical protein
MKKLALAFVMLAAVGGAFAKTQATSGTSTAIDATLDSMSATQYAWADAVNPASGNTLGFAGSFASLATSPDSAWTMVGTSPIDGATLAWNYTVDRTKKSGAFYITSDKAVVLDLAVAVHAGNASGAWLFDNLNLAANEAQIGTFAINWTNGGGQHPDFSNITLFARDVKVSAGIPVSPVPEPESYAMMIAALGAMGFLARRKRS